MKKQQNRIKRLQKNNMTFLEMKSIKGQNLNPTEEEALTKGKIDGLLPLSVKKSGNGFTLIYDITGLESLKNYLQTTVLDKQLFGFLLQNILTMLKLLEANYFHFSSLLVTLGKVKVDPASKRLYFIYVPIQNYDNGVNLKEFLLSIIDYAHFSDSEDNSFVSDYIRILNTGVNFSVFDLQEYIYSLTGTPKNEKATKKCPRCGKIVPKEANFCTECRYEFSAKSPSGSLPGGGSIYNPADPAGEDKPPKGNTGNDFDWGKDWNDIDDDDDDAGNSYTDDNDEPQRGSTDNIGTSVLGSGDDDDEPEMPTTLLDEPKKIVKTGVLKRLENGEKREIDKNEYLVGRSLKCDFSVPDNTAVGRRHAYIIKSGGRFYLRDNNSTNRTYINGKVIPPDVNTEIFNNTKIRLANEDFVFTVITKEE